MLYTLQKLIAAQSNRESISYSQVKGDAAEGRNTMLVSSAMCSCLPFLFIKEKLKQKLKK